MEHTGDQRGLSTAAKSLLKVKELIGIALIAGAVYCWFQLMPDPLPPQPRHRARAEAETTTAPKPTASATANQSTPGSLADRWKQ